MRKKYIIEVDESEIIEYWSEQGVKEIGYQEYALKDCPSIKVKLYEERPQSDLISRKALRENVNAFYDNHFKGLVPNELITYAKAVDDLIDNAPTVERPQGEWIPVSEKLPDDLEPVNITWLNHEPEPYYKDIKDKPFTATGVYFNDQWYWWSTLCTDILAEYSHNFDDVIDSSIEVIAWQPLPEPYEKGGALV